MKNEKALRARKTSLNSYQLTANILQLRKKEVEGFRIKEFLLKSIGCLMSAVRKPRICLKELELRIEKMKKGNKYEQ